MNPNIIPEAFMANAQRFLVAIKEYLPRLELLLKEMNDFQENLVLPFYWSSFKCFITGVGGFLPYCDEGGVVNKL